MRELGKGGQARVFLAHDPRLDRQVALKVVTLARGQAGRHLLREMEAASRIDHPAICPVHDYGHDGTHAWLAMHYVEGATLDELDTQGRTGVERLVAIGEKLAAGLETLHGHGVIHRDVTPRNVIVTSDDAPVLIDFGIARIDGGTSAMSLAGSASGTAAFMAPEQMTPEVGRIDQRADVYGLGATLYAVLTRRPPHAGGSMSEVHRSINSSGAVNARRFNAAVPRDLVTVLKTALAVDPDRRYQTATDLREDLRCIRERRPIRARRAGPLRRLGSWARRRPAVAALLASLFFVLSGAILWTLHAAHQRTVALSQRIEALESLRLISDNKRQADAHRAARLLWPPHPDLVPRLEEWQTRVSSLLETLQERVRFRDELREGATPASDEERSIFHAEALERIVCLEAELAALNSLEGRAARRFEDRLVVVSDRLRTEKETLSAQPIWLFGDDFKTQFVHDETTALVEGLLALSDPENGVQRDVTRRIALARSIHQATVDKHREAWAKTQGGIAHSPHYGGLSLAPVVGLVPLGPDPHSGLFEFLHWLSHDPTHEIPTRARTGQVGMDGRTGIILVLIPELRFAMGARRPSDGETEGPGIDPRANPEEWPVHDVALRPFFISKFEMTRGQWVRAAWAPDPSWWIEDSDDVFIPFERLARYAVTNASWHQAQDALFRMGLGLPTEAQWEGACRAGTTTPFSFGSNPADLARHGNVADRSYKHSGASRDDHDDGFDDQAPPGSFLPNGFGLFDMHGNVAEWCRDWPGKYDGNRRPGTGERIVELPGRARAIRSGHYRAPSSDARSSSRGLAPADQGRDILGIRPARDLDR